MDKICRLWTLRGSLPGLEGRIGLNLRIFHFECPPDNFIEFLARQGHREYLLRIPDWQPVDFYRRNVYHGPFGLLE